MNAQRRKEIARLISQIDELRGMRDNIRDEIDTIRSEEEEYYEAMPESFQNGEKGEKAQTAMDALQTAYDNLDGMDLDEVEASLNEASDA